MQTVAVQLHRIAFCGHGQLGVERRLGTVFDDGTGPALYAGGRFGTAGGVGADFIAQWNGTSWAPLGSGLGGPVSALTVLDDGSGPALYAGGSFFSAGGESSNGIAKWDGTSWAPLGRGSGLDRADALPERVYIIKVAGQRGERCMR